MPNSVDQELARARKLLSPRRVKTPLTETDPDPAPGVIGALAGIGFKTHDPEVLFSVYVFEDWDGSSGAVEDFESLHEDDESVVYTAAYMNGRLVLYGVVAKDHPDSEDAQTQLSVVVSAFAGDE